MLISQETMMGLNHQVIHGNHDDVKVIISVPGINITEPSIKPSNEMTPNISQILKKN